MQKEHIGGFAEPDDAPDTSHPATVEVPDVGNDYKREKYIALYQARTVLAKVGTMAERRVCSTQLKRMQKLGKEYL